MSQAFDFDEALKALQSGQTLIRKDGIFDYIEVFYNRSRCHSHPGGISPDTFERASA